MKKFLSPLKVCLLLAGSAALVSSCQDYEPFNEQQVQDVAYNREFTRQFGDIDPNQNWDLFGQLARGYVRASTRATDSNGVDVTNANDSYVVTKQESEEYRTVLPESNRLTRVYSETNLGRVTDDFVSTAHTFTIAPAYYYTGGDDVIGIYWYSDDPISGVTTTVQGNDGNTYYLVRSVIYQNKSNLVGVRNKTYWEEATVGTDEQWNLLISNFPDRYVIADGSDTYRDANWNVFAKGKKIFNTGVKNEWGDFYNYKEFPTSPTGTDQSQYLENVLKNDLCTVLGYKVTDGSSTYKNSGGGNWYAGALVYEKSEPEEVGSNNTQTSEGFFANGAEYLLSTPITVTVPSTVPSFGFWLSNANNGIVYSEKKLNAPYVFEDAGEKKVGYVATFDMDDIKEGEDEGKRYLCFEDWYPGSQYGGSDFDLNDLVFTVTGMDGTTIIDNESTNESAILVCEDLASFDFDFNDIALKLNYVDGVTREYELDPDGNVTSVTVIPGNRQLTVTALAAGGAFESTLFINGEEWGEIHTLLGESGTHDAHAHSIINAGKAYGGDGATKTIKTGLPDKDESYPTFLSQLFDTDNFFKIVCEGNKEAERIIANNTYSEGEAPQMMLLPDYFEWPQELVYINDAYEDFMNWVQDVTQVDWIYTSQIEKNITDRGDLYIETNLGRFVGTEELPVSTNLTFTYTDKNGRETTYSNCSKVDFTGLRSANLEADDYALLTITFTSKPEGRSYLDFADGTQLMEDMSGAETTHTYRLAKSQLQKAITTGAIYLMGQGNVPVVISNAKVDIYR